MTTRILLPQPSRAGIPSSAEVASDYIRTLVFTGVLRPAQKVPVDDIAEVLGMSRQPVREAIIELSYDGLVTIEGRRGTFVADFGPSVIRDHYELYGLLQSFAIRRVARNVAQDVNGGVVAALRAIEAEAANESDTGELARMLIEFSRVINRAAGNARLKRVIGSMARFTPGEYYLDEVPDAVERSRSTIREQLAAIESGDPERAAEVVMRSWARTGENLIARLVESGVFPSGDPEASGSTSPAQGAHHGN